MVDWLVGWCWLYSRLDGWSVGLLDCWSVVELTCGSRLQEGRWLSLHLSSLI